MLNTYILRKEIYLEQLMQFPIALKITSVVESRLSDTFEVHGVLSMEEVCDRI